MIEIAKPYGVRWRTGGLRLQKVAKQENKAFKEAQKLEIHENEMILNLLKPKT